jgi:hypothetical protein
MHLVRMIKDGLSSVSAGLDFSWNGPSQHMAVGVWRIGNGAEVGSGKQKARSESSPLLTD